VPVAAADLVLVQEAKEETEHRGVRRIALAAHRCLDWAPLQRPEPYWHDSSLAYCRVSLQQGAALLAPLVSSNC
jgi:hypothetical protein